MLNDTLDCNNLRSIAFGDNSLSMTQFLSISNNPNLITLDIGSNALSLNSYENVELLEEAKFTMYSTIYKR